MASGIRATVAFPDEDVCRIASLSATAETTITRVGGSVCTEEADGTVSEFSTDAELSDSDLTPVFVHGTDRRYRLSHGGEPTCPCECLGAHGRPIARYTARDGTLTLVFHAADFEELQTTVQDLRDRFPQLDVKRFVRAPDGEVGTENVLVDRGKLTARQLEIVETAHAMGYFDRPRRANATEVAAELDISPSTFSEHLAAAQRKLLGELL